MNHPLRPLSCIALLLAAVMSPALADPHKDESGHGRKGRGGPPHKETYWDGYCKVERKWEKNGGFKEKRKCREPAPQPVYEAPRHGYPPPTGIVVQPPAVVIQPPTVIIRP
jgi:hypothetical protein